MEVLEGGDERRRKLIDDFLSPRSKRGSSGGRGGGGVDRDSLLRSFGVEPRVRDAGPELSEKARAFRADSRISLDDLYRDGMSVASDRPGVVPEPGAASPLSNSEPDLETFSLVRPVVRGALQTGAHVSEFISETLPNDPLGRVAAKRFADLLMEEAQSIPRSRIATEGQELVAEEREALRERLMVADRLMSLLPPEYVGAAVVGSNVERSLRAMGAAAGRDPQSVGAHIAETTLESAPTLAATMAAGSVGGLPAMTAAGIAMETGALLSEAVRDDGGERVRDLDPVDKLLAYGAGTAAGTLEMVGALGILRGADEIVAASGMSPSSQRKFMRELGKGLQAAGKSATGEGSTEVLQGIISDAAAKAGWDEGRAIGASSVENFLSGFLLGGGASAGRGAAGRIQRRLSSPGGVEVESEVEGGERDVGEAAEAVVPDVPVEEPGDQRPELEGELRTDEPAEEAEGLRDGAQEAHDEPGLEQPEESVSRGDLADNAELSEQVEDRIPASEREFANGEDYAAFVFEEGTLEDLAMLWEQTESESRYDGTLESILVDHFGNRGNKVFVSTASLKEYAGAVVKDMPKGAKMAFLRSDKGGGIGLDDFVHNHLKPENPELENLDESELIEGVVEFMLAHESISAAKDARNPLRPKIRDRYTELTGKRFLDSSMQKIYDDMAEKAASSVPGRIGDVDTYLATPWGVEAAQEFSNMYLDENEELDLYRLRDALNDEASQEVFLDLLKKNFSGNPQQELEDFRRLVDGEIRARERNQDTEGSSDAEADSVDEEVVSDDGEVEADSGTSGSEGFQNEEGEVYLAGVVPNVRTGPIVGKDRVQIPEELQSVNAVAEARLQKAEEGILSKGFRERTADILQKIKETRRSYFAPKLDPKQFAPTIDVLRILTNARSFGDYWSRSRVTEVVEPLGPTDYKIFSRYLALRDVSRSISEGLYEDKSLPFGYESVAEVEADLSNLDAVVKANPVLQESFKKRTAFARELVEELVEYNQLPEEALDNVESYFHRQVLEYFNASEDPNFVGTSAGSRTRKKGFQKGRRGGSDFNLRYHESEIEWMAQARTNLETLKAQRSIHRMNDISDELREVAKQNDVSVESIIPDGYTQWQPEVGTHFYSAMAMPEQVIAEALERGEMVSPEQARKVLAVGRRKNTWIIPRELAETLDRFGEQAEPTIPDAFMRGLQSAWKQWVLISPMRVIKYNINNTSGDLDVALAYDPKMLKFTKQAAKDAWSFQNLSAKGELRAELEEAVRYGAIDSGFKAVEVSDITKNDPFFKVLTGESTVIDKAIKSVWTNPKNFTQWRENILRLSAYRYFRERLKNGERPLDTASPKDEMQQMYEAIDSGDKTIEEAAAKMARELIGDYGNISQGGQWLRAKVIPFWAWTEINAPRYIRLFKNASSEDAKKAIVKRGALTVARRSATSVASLSVRAAMLFAMVSMYNRFVWPDEYEELARTGRNRQLHLILGRDSDGNIRTLRVQGALSDALESPLLPIGGSDLVADIDDVMKGRMSVKTKLIDGPVTVANKMINSVVPIPKALLEAAIGARTYPRIMEVQEDAEGNTKIVWKPTAIRDRREHLTSTYSLDWLYREITGKPNQPVGDYLSGWVTYKTDPSQAAYYHARSLQFQYLDKHSDAVPSFGFTDKANALYAYRRAIVYGQEKRAEKYLQKYYELGGTKSGLKKSIASQHPLSRLSGSDLDEFLDGLSENDMKAVDQGMDYYIRLFNDGKVDSKTSSVRRKIGRKLNSGSQ